MHPHFIECPMCRLKTPLDTVSYVKPKRQDEVPSIVVKGSFSTKIESITLKLLELIAEDPLVKVIIFSTVSFYIFKSLNIVIRTTYNCSMSIIFLLKYVLVGKSLESSRRGSKSKFYRLSSSKNWKSL